MARYDVYHFNGGFVVDLQCDFVTIPGSRVVAPLIPGADVPETVRGLHPQIEFRDQPLVLATHLLAATPVGAMSGPVGNCRSYADDITRALDLLFIGY
ncbi:CcdB family protein [Sulfitobacter sp. JB4-11]|uniref:CcdB family protein n=1 Tax=Sulfitobacter rhodophyticola TaxID=3238304 RepID=UPI003511778C